MDWTEKDIAAFEFHKKRINDEWKAGCEANDRLKEFLESRKDAPLSISERMTLLVWRNETASKILQSEQPSEIPVMPTIKDLNTITPKKSLVRFWKFTFVFFDRWTNKYGLAVEWDSRKTLFTIGF